MEAWNRKRAENRDCKLGSRDSSLAARPVAAFRQEQRLWRCTQLCKANWCRRRGNYFSAVSLAENSFTFIKIAVTELVIRTTVR
jgi:hypothetical protein